MPLSLLESLPEHCLELIMDHLDCDDFNSILKSSNRLAGVGREVRRMREMRLHQVLRQNGIAKWRLLHRKNITKKDTSPGNRLGSTLVCYDQSVYLFGGATVNWTTFNDLWRFDLGEKAWSRRLPRGTCPPPRASASGIICQNKLIIIGGFELTYNIHAKGMSNWDNLPWIYDFLRNEWKMMMVDTTLLSKLEEEDCNNKFTLSPTPVGQSSCLMMDDQIILFGGAKVLLNQSQGYNRHNPILPIGLSNDTFSLSISSSIISNINIFGDVKPLKRCGHSAMSINRNKMLILGGNLGPNTKGTEDIWMLTCVEPLIDSCICNSSLNDAKDRIWYWAKIIIDSKLQPPSSFLNNAMIFSGENKVTGTLIVLGGGSDEVENTMITKRKVEGRISLQTEVSQQGYNFYNKTSRLIVHSVDLTSLLYNNECNACGGEKLLRETITLHNNNNINNTLCWTSPETISQDLEHAPSIKQAFAMAAGEDSIFIYGGICYKSVYTRPVYLLNDLMARDSDFNQENVSANSDLHQLTFASRAIML